MRLATDDFDNLPAVSDVIRVMLDATGPTTFRLRIENVSTSTTLSTSDGMTHGAPLAPGVWAVHSGDDALFTVGQPDRGEGLEGVAEDGAMPSFWNLSAMCQDTYGEGARLARTSEVAYLLERGELQWEGVDRAVFRSSYPIPLQDGLYDTLVSAPVDLDGLVIFDAASDRFVDKNPVKMASPACSARG